MKRLSGIIILLLCCVAQVKALTTTEQLAQIAQSHYQQKRYDSAAYYYEQALAKAPGTSSLCYNLGNAYYKANKIGSAVLNYERALFYDPSNTAAADNLQLTKSRITNQIQAPRDIFFVRWWSKISRGDHATTWAITSLLIFLLLVLTVLLQRMGKLGIQMPAQFYFIGALAWVLSLLVAYTSADNAAHSGKAVVMADNTPFTNVPGNTKTQSLIPEGVTVEIGATDKDWIAVTLPDGRKGWMQRNWLSQVQM